MGLTGLVAELVVLGCYAAAVVTNALLLTSCDLLDLGGGLNSGSLGLFLWNDPRNEQDECFDYPPGREREIEDKALKCAQVCAVIAICFGGVVFVFGFFKQCVIPLPCSQRIMDLSSTCVQIFLGLIYVVWASKACDFYKCSYGGEGACLLIVTQFLWLGAGLFSRCIRDGRWERRDEIKAQKELKKEEKARKAGHDHHGGHPQASINMAIVFNSRRRLVGVGASLFTAWNLVYLRSLSHWHVQFIVQGKSPSNKLLDELTRKEGPSYLNNTSHILRSQTSVKNTSNTTDNTFATGLGLERPEEPIYKSPTSEKNHVSSIPVEVSNVDREAPTTRTSQDETTSTHFQAQRRFSDPNRLQELVSLGPHFLTTQSGCRIARWFYSTGYNLKKYMDCSRQSSKLKLLRHTHLLKPNDTIYVTFTKLEEFVETALNNITVDVVILSGQIQIVPTLPFETIDKLLSHPHVIHWFCQNIPIYGGKDPHHPKISPFPYGLKEVVHKPKLNEALEAYKKEFLRTLLDGSKEKTRIVYAGYLRSLPERASIPVEGTSPLEPTEFFKRMVNATYILSPNGDRPECYRHYEAIGLGTVPITQLDPVLFRHLQEGPVIYNNTNWNLTSLGLHLSPSPKVNRNLVFEEYWIEYIDWTVGRSLTWWETERRRPQLLKGILQQRKRKGEEK